VRGQVTICYYFEKFVRSVVFGCFYQCLLRILLGGYAREMLSLSAFSPLAIGIMAGGYLCIHTAFAHFMEKV
jgi:hypothetical protein